MSRTLVKICGITRPEDAAAAARCGADFVGMVLHAHSPRTITVDRAQQIIEALPPGVTPVGLFVDAPLERVRETAERLRLSVVQLHGGETEPFAKSLRPLRVWKMLRVDASLDAMRLKTWGDAAVDAVVLETANTPVAGGSGRENDWAAVERLYDRLDRSAVPRLIAAGGLNPHNVADVVRRLRPWIVDVSSGVEESVKGAKSEEKIRAFVRAAGEA